MKFRTNHWTETLQKWVAFVCVTLTACVFWGFVVAGVLRYLVNLQSDYVSAVIFPVAVAVAVFFVANRETLFTAMGFNNGGIR